MGGAMARTLVRAGWTVLGYDPDPAQVAAAAAAGVLGVDDRTALAGRADHVVLSLPGAAQVRATVPALLAAAAPPRVIVDTTTSDPDTTRAVAAEAARRGVGYLDAPVSGGRAGAESGTLGAFVGGTPEAVAAAGPALEALTGGRAVHVGDSGAGNVAKLLNNAMCAAHLALTGEAVAAARSYGLAPDRLIAALNTASGRSAVTEVNYPRWILTESFDSGFPVRLMSRDVALCLDVLSRTGSAPGVLGAAGHVWAEAARELAPGTDFNAVAELAARLSAAGGTATPAAEPR
ncbi:NAD(P)-dependent oxidoreductase [Marinitenerispora sediminis]|uniref:NAD(P)-dependent oxidoreductase n=2 Tax=Marinitenerispora sediminis TaxID=1931232 RepID=A0A368SYX0_9ACTN|nr:NAD(P)-dependent oxidoreductase [Marinitenerispora sediminis]RCV49658.1 NAD(P)-dependent oxidoreductase [Marinitenerispora sediminis]